MKKKKIIIVEDDPGISDILRIVLEKNHYAVEEYVNGNSIISGQITLPDLFLLDKQLEEMDGLDICRHLKNDPRTSYIPVIVVSATPGIEQTALQAGADAFLEKPFTSKSLLDTIEQLVYASPVH